MSTHARVVKRVVGLYDDGSVKPFRAVDRLEAAYVHRCCSADRQTVCGPVRWRNPSQNIPTGCFFLFIYFTALLNRNTSQEPAGGEFATS